MIAQDLRDWASVHVVYIGGWAKFFFLNFKNLWCSCGCYTFEMYPRINDKCVTRIKGPFMTVGCMYKGLGSQVWPVFMFYFVDLLVDGLVLEVA